MIDEGYVKYQCHWVNSPSITREEIEDLNQWRNQFYQLGLIGQYDNGIGFGNVSIRCLDNPHQFIISGTKTGGLEQLTEKQYTLVTDYNWQENWLTCRGLIEASSEALTHAAVYTANPNINAVIHVHHLQLWKTLMNKVPTTAENIPYGTPEMAQEIIRLCQMGNLKEAKILVMRGHEEGIIAFGRNLDEAGNLLLLMFKQNDYELIKN
ncbi:class II aldolase/adducin family protein [Gloeothece citriformis PCC 7424]|uniref:Class II aldolase/adducin family protein n=1 Tax=Gloeothece citriformis (strain PCC 7424) TaxID=65393 RepID=B7KCY8_GLOC7|nr:class II aldolase/adducin family protein [Gloeothece citriformis]ACK73109.1 class II aldolase/adducin family protein [Gloeothece citriformis PCC 7424]